MEQERPEDTSAPLPRPLGTYVLLRSLGRGGMGSVFLAMQRLEIFERPCVIKLIRQRLVDHERHRQRFLEEARTTLSLSHRNICRVLDVGVEDGTIYLAMEYVAGRDLRAVLRRCHERKERVPTAIAMFVLVELLEALDAAHTHVDANSGAVAPIVHRDVSPHNVVLGFDGGIKLIDFGIASSATARVNTDPGLVLGKTAYMAPEQAAGGHVDGRADVYAAAITATEVLCGERFYGALQFDEILSLLEHSTHRPASFSGVDAGLRAALDAALAHDPAARPTARELADRVRAWAHDHDQLADAAAVRDYLTERFDGEETAERRLQQDLLRAARGELSAIDATASASRALTLVDDARTATGADSTPTSLDRKKPTTVSAGARNDPAAPVPVRRRRRLRAAPLIGGLALSIVALGALAIRHGAGRDTELPRSDAAAAAYRAGIAHRLLMEHPQARARFEEAVRGEPGHAPSHARLAQTMFMSGQYLDGKAAAKRALDLRDTVADEHRDLIEAVDAEARRDWVRAIDALRRSARTHNRIEDWLELARVQTGAADAAAAFETLAIARQHPDSARALILIQLLEAAAARGSGDMDRGLAAARAARADAETHGLASLTAHALFAEGIALMYLGPPDAARATLKSARDRFVVLGDTAARAGTLLTLGAVDAGDADDAGETEATLLEALAAFREARDKEGEALALNNLAAEAEARGEYDKHLQLLKQAIAICREAGDWSAIATTATNLGMTLGLNGDLRGGRLLILEAVAAARRAADPLDLAWALAALGQLDSVTGNIKDARAASDEALALTRGTSVPTTRAYVLLTGAEVLLAAGALDEAEAMFESAAHDAPAGYEAWPVVGRERTRLAAGKTIDPAPLREMVDPAQTENSVELLVLTGTAALAQGDRSGAQRDLDAARVLVSARPGLSYRSAVDVLDARLRARAGDRAMALRLVRQAIDAARTLGALSWALDHELALAELGDRSRLSAVRAEAERLGVLRVAKRAEQLATPDR